LCEPTDKSKFEISRCPSFPFSSLSPHLCRGAAYIERKRERLVIVEAIGAVDCVDKSQKPYGEGVFGDKHVLDTVCKRGE
jgi:hypothetical protein